MKQIASNLVPVLLLGLAASGPSSAQGNDLRRVVELALSHNPGLQAILERQVEVDAGVKMARAEALPQLAVVSSWSRAQQPSLLNSSDFEAFVDIFPGGSFEPQEQELLYLALELRQTLFTWGRLGAAIDLARFVRDAAQAQVDTARLDAAYAAAVAYYGLLSAREELSTVEIQGRMRRESLAVVEARYEIADATRLELLRSQAALAEVAPRVAQARGQIEVAESRLRAAIGLGAGARLDLDPVTGALPVAAAFSPSLRLALRRRPEVRDLELQTEVLGKQHRIVRAEGRPQFELLASYGRESRTFGNLSDPRFDSWKVGLGVRWDLFAGGGRRHELKAIDSQERQLEWRRSELLDRVALEVESALAEYHTARERWLSAQLSAHAAREASRVAEEAYAEGAALQTALLDAQNQEAESGVLSVKAFYDALIKAARLSRAVGLYPTTAWGQIAGLGEGTMESGEYETADTRDHQELDERPTDAYAARSQP